MRISVDLPWTSADQHRAHMLGLLSRTLALPIFEDPEYGPGIQYAFWVAVQAATSQVHSQVAHISKLGIETTKDVLSAVSNAERAGEGAPAPISALSISPPPATSRMQVGHPAPLEPQPLSSPSSIGTRSTSRCPKNRTAFSRSLPTSSQCG